MKGSGLALNEVPIASTYHNDINATSSSPADNSTLTHPTTSKLFNYHVPPVFDDQHSTATPPDS